MKEQALEALREQGKMIEAPREVPAKWEPNILAFACHYFAFAAADLAGVMRLSYPTNVKIIRLPCTGKLDHSYVLHAFEKKTRKTSKADIALARARYKVLAEERKRK